MRELEGKTAHPPHAGHWFDGLLTVVRNRASWPGFWVTFGYAGSFFAFAGLWAVPYLQDVHGMSRDIATRHTSLLLAGFAFGAMTVGAVSDRIGRRRPVLIGAGLLAAIGAGASEASLDLPAMKRVEDWIWGLAAPRMAAVSSSMFGLNTVAPP